MEEKNHIDEYGESNDEHTICTLFCTNKKSELFQARFNVYLELFSNFSAWKSFHFFIKSSFLFFVSRFVQQSKHVFLVSFYARLVKRLQRDKDCVKLFPTIRCTNQYLKTAKAKILGLEYIHKDPDMCKCLQKIAYINLSKMPAYWKSQYWYSRKRP